MGLDAQNCIYRHWPFFSFSPNISLISQKSCRADTRRSSAIGDMQPRSAEPQAFRYGSALRDRLNSKSKIKELLDETLQRD